ncbi:Tn3 family transposase [Nostoc sp. 'Peltigera membranacea cyanobiont' 232]|uniref:Tn3 family transposase n=1 Tax=Nostoc sp. 'Peltigera membranacea cyanobiont' 232 TaxID=2014531 RepID=UPI000B951D12|nr:Tn3 family transposase [Nostoc sp. 'Peltigera membranacea cyanobiont' 232]OYE01953.1 DDE transposase [Nostoc sp. 'Peltigera membranacea cyanobiont' 232]
MKDEGAEVTRKEKRLKILATDEIESIYNRPYFTQAEQIEYFTLSQLDLEIVEGFGSIKSQVYFIIQLGYFRAKHLFFVFTLDEVERDFLYIIEQHFNSKQIGGIKVIDKQTRLKQQRLILKLHRYRLCGKEERLDLEQKAQQSAKIYSKPIYVFRELINYLTDQQIVIPGYSLMQDIVSRALTAEHNRLTKIIHERLQTSETEAFEKLLEDSPGLYEITQLKQEPKDFSLKEIKCEIHRGDKLHFFYKIAQNLLPEMGISNESIKYYAALVGYYSVARLKQLNKWTAYIYIICFAHHRYQQHSDNLINCLISRVRHYSDEAKSVAKERLYECHIEINENFQKAGQVLKLLTDEKIEADTPFKTVQSSIFGILPRQKLILVAERMAKTASFDETAFQWEHIDKLSHQFKLHLRQIIVTVEFTTTLSQDTLIEAIDFLKAVFKKGKALREFQSELFPVECVPASVISYLYTGGSEQEKQLIPDRYEFLIYRLLRNGLESGDISCRNSIHFRSLEDDLIDNLRWQDKQKLMIGNNLTILTHPIIEHLASLEKNLEERILEVNRRIADGENEHFQIKKRRDKVRWNLLYPQGIDLINAPLFDSLKQVDIANILHFVDRHCHFIKAFEHVLGRYHRQTVDEHVIIACLIAWGNNMGMRRMGQISDISYQLLTSTSENFIRLETLKDANDLISNAIYNLSIFHHYDIDNMLHSSSDGQKFEARINTINSRYSPKYFGLNKGVVSYTLVANHIPVNARIIGANEHESHFVFDILFNNTTDIQPNIHSTDTHGTNEINFAILHSFGYQFAPRYKDIYDLVSKSLYGFQHPSNYDKDHVIKPIRKINTELIVEEWENIQRIMVSLAVKETTQSIIVGKLSAYARKNKTRRALWEYDNILKSLYLLDYIDSLPLRQNVQRALNRGESYHQLRRAISHANFGKLRFKSELEQQLWSECGRLIANCILYYNAKILSGVLDHQEQLGDVQGVDVLKQISPVAWQHVNLYGRYEFRKFSDSIDLDAIVQQLTQAPSH